MAKKILIVEDDDNIRELLRLYLEREGYEITEAENGAVGLSKWKAENPDMMLLDVMMPVMDGWQVCKEVRAAGSTMPIIMITAKGETMDKVSGLELGADDYIVKPFNPLELMARVKTQLRRYTRYNLGERVAEEATEHDFGGLTICKTTHKCTLYGEELNLTPLEFAILWYLCDHRGEVVPSETLFEAAWGEKYLNSNNTVMTHIARLREKMHEPSRKPKFIKTVWGVGYTIE